MRRFISSVRLMVVSGTVIVLAVAGCSGAGDAAGPTASAASREAGLFTKSVSACFINDLAEPVTTIWSFSDANDGGGKVAAGGRQCGEGAGMTYDVGATLEFPDGIRIRPAFANPAIGQPFFITDSTTSQAKGWATTDFAEGETASPIAYPYGHELVVTRLANSNWINFEVHVTK